MLERELTRLAGDNWQVSQASTVPFLSLSLSNSSFCQASLEIIPQQPTSANPLRSGVNLHHRSNTIASLPRLVPSSSPISFRTSHSQSPPPTSARSALHKKQNSQSRCSPLDDHALEGKEKEEGHRQAQIAHLEQIRLLILGMEQRLEVREEKLVKAVEQAENEGKKYEAAAAATQKFVGVGAQ